MRILILNWRDSTHPWAGGAEVFLLETARRWVQGGNQVTWLCGRHPSQAARDCVAGIDIRRQGGIYSVYPQAALYYLSRLGGKFDVVLESVNGVPFFSPLYCRIPLVALVHHVHREVFNFELPRFQARLADAAEGALMPLVYRHTAFVTVSESSRRALAHIGIPAGRIRIVYNGVDRRRFKPGCKSDRPLVVFLGRLRHYKSVDVAIRAVPELLRAIPDLEFRILGSGEAETGLRELAGCLGVAGQVHFHGRASADECVYWLQQAHVVVQPSLKEGWGLTVMEANACGTPVVASNVAGLCDSVRDGITGVLVPQGNPLALAQGVKRLLLDPDLRDTMSRNALAWAAQFDWERTAAACLRALADAIQRRQAQ